MSTPYLVTVTIDQFNRQPYKVQLAAVYDTGTFLATRWQAENEAVNLYHLPGGIFVELTYDTAANSLLDWRSFTSSTQLEDYAVSIQLPEGLDNIENL